MGLFPEIVQKPVEMLCRHRVIVFPPDDWGGLFVADDKLILRAAAGVHTRVGHQRAVLGDMRLVPLQSEFVELRAPKFQRRPARPRKPKRSAPNCGLCSPVSIIQHFL